MLLIGPPGIGKTQIMQQIAEETGVGLVSYTLTHHTRQSALGLPFIEKVRLGGEERTVTSYTMSEIIASVYREIECSAKRSAISSSRQDGWSWRPEIRPSTINPCANLTL